mmetsp:Transcript_21250/g.46306  ORF Transcript_21250/g.46306 Transcript_21250/m.46306 type:complete len:289 (+) Transcript_21250:1560-2426(+)
MVAVSAFVAARSAFSMERRAIGETGREEEPSRTVLVSSLMLSAPSHRSEASATVRLASSIAVCSCASARIEREYSSDAAAMRSPSRTAACSVSRYPSAKNAEAAVGSSRIDATLARAPVATCSTALRTAACASVSGAARVAASARAFVSCATDASIAEPHSCSARRSESTSPPTAEALLTAVSNDERAPSLISSAACTAPVTRFERSTPVEARCSRTCHAACSIELETSFWFKSETVNAMKEAAANAEGPARRSGICPSSSLNAQNTRERGTAGPEGSANKAFLGWRA